MQRCYQHVRPPAPDDAAPPNPSLGPAIPRNGIAYGRRGLINQRGTSSIGSGGSFCGRDDTITASYAPKKRTPTPQTSITGSVIGDHATANQYHASSNLRGRPGNACNAAFGKRHNRITA